LIQKSLKRINSKIISNKTLKNKITIHFCSKFSEIEKILTTANYSFLKQLNLPIFISSRKWERTNIFLQAIKNWQFRRRWLKGESLKSIYSDYYKK